MRVVFNEVSLKGKRTYVDESGKRRQETKKFWQTVNPFNKNADGSIKTREQILIEIGRERDDWLSARASGKGG